MLFLAGCSMASSLRSVKTDWLFITDNDNIGAKEGFYKNEYDTSAWISMPCNTVWENIIGAYDGNAWYKRVESFTKDDLKNHKYIYMKFKGVDEEATVYVNGKLVIEHTVEKTKLPPEILWATSFSVNIKPFLKDGENQIKVKVYDIGLAGGIYAPVSFVLTNTEDKQFKSKSIIELNPDFEENIKVGLKTYGPKFPLSLLWFSDIHGDEIELRRLVDFYDYYVEYFDGAIATGDLITDSCQSDWSFWGKTKGAEYIMLVIGNHDTLKSHLDGYHWSEQISQKETYDRYLKDFIKYWNVRFVEGQTYYYKDYEEKAIRLICLDCMLFGKDQIAQCEWLEEKLKEAKEKQLSVLIAIHFPTIYNKFVPIECNFNDIDSPLILDKGYPSSENNIIYKEAVEKFISEGGSFICWFGGHHHCDNIGFDERFPNQLQISIGSSNRLSGPMEDDLNRTYGEKSMDLANSIIVDTNTNTVKLIRIGADRDKYFRTRDFLCVNYKTKEIIR